MARGLGLFIIGTGIREQRKNASAGKRYFWKVGLSCPGVLFSQKQPRLSEPPRVSARSPVLTETAAWRLLRYRTLADLGASVCQRSAPSCPLLLNSNVGRSPQLTLYPPVVTTAFVSLTSANTIMENPGTFFICHSC